MLTREQLLFSNNSLAQFLQILSRANGTSHQNVTINRRGKFMRNIITTHAQIAANDKAMSEPMRKQVALRGAKRRGKVPEGKTHISRQVTRQLLKPWKGR